MTELYHEITPEGFGIAIEKDKDLYSKKSPFQQIDIFHSRAFGNVMTLDGLMMTTERDEFFYHEMIVHIPMLTHPNPENVLVIGGGDGGTVREILKHPSVKRVDMVEIDGDVIEACKEFQPTISCALDDKRVNVLVQDAVEFIKDKENVYDVVLSDSTDPIGPGEGLFNVNFYNNVKKALRKGGIVVPQTESPFAQSENMQKTYQMLRKVFKNVAPYWVLCRHTLGDIGLGDFVRMMLKFLWIALKLMKKERLKFKKLAKSIIERFIAQFFVFQIL